jgi:MFS family permease
MMTMKSPTSRMITFGSMMRTFGGIAVATYLPLYFLRVYPEYKQQFAVANALSLAIGGLISSMAGGIIADKMEAKDYRAKSWVCIVSSLMAFPLTAICCLIRGNFWLSMSAIILKTLLASCFMSPAMTMI